MEGGRNIVLLNKCRRWWSTVGYCPQRNRIYKGSSDTKEEEVVTKAITLISMFRFSKQVFVAA